MKTSGIYKLVDETNNLIYIGKAKILERRINRHFYDFNNNENQRYLQDSYNNDHKFKSEIIEYCDESKLEEREEYWIKKLNSIWPNGYNIWQGSNAKNFKHSDETKTQMSKVAKGKSKSKEHRENIAKGKLGNTYSRKLTLEQCFQIKGMLLEKTDEYLQAKDERIGKLFNVEKQQVGKIRTGKHWSNKDLGGGLKDWV